MATNNSLRGIERFRPYSHLLCVKQRQLIIKCHVRTAETRKKDIFHRITLYIVSPSNMRLSSGSFQGNKKKWLLSKIQNARTSCDFSTQNDSVPFWPMCKIDAFFYGLKLFTSTVSKNHQKEKVTHVEINIRHARDKLARTVGRDQLTPHKTCLI